MKWIKVAANGTLTCIECGALVADNYYAKELHEVFHKSLIRQPTVRAGLESRERT